MGKSFGVIDADVEHWEILLEVVQVIRYFKGMLSISFVYVSLAKNTTF